MKPGSARRLLPWAPLAIRLPLSAIFIAHGAQSLFGLWNGPGLPATIVVFETSMGIPGFLTLVGVATEFLGGIAVGIGLLTRFASLALSINMVVVIVRVHLVNGFFLNWSMAPGKGHGYELPLRFSP